MLQLKIVKTFNGLLYDNAIDFITDLTKYSTCNSKHDTVHIDIIKFPVALFM